MTAAIIAAQKGVQVTLFEANPTLGKKILASGNGRCNLSNTFLSTHSYWGCDPTFVAHALKTITFEDVVDFFAQLGLLVDIKPDGKAYPHSYEARSVSAVLEAAARRYGVRIYTHTFIQSITKEHTFALHSRDHLRWSGFDTLLLATGLGAAPQLGSNESGLEMAASLGHTICSTYPCLVQLELSGAYFAKMQGVKLQGSVTPLIEGVAVTTFRGDVLFTNYGISGLAVLDASFIVSHALALGKKVTLSVSLLLDWDYERLCSWIAQHTQSGVTIDLFLEGLVGKKVSMALLEVLGWSHRMTLNTLHPKMIKALAQQLFDWHFEVLQTHGFKHAEVSAGGVVTSEINPATMASKKVKGLYFAGELMDIVGLRGGYNFHFAWASAMLAAHHIGS